MHSLDRKAAYATAQNGAAYGDPIHAHAVEWRVVTLGIHILPQCEPDALRKR